MYKKEKLIAISVLLLFILNGCAAKKGSDSLKNKSNKENTTTTNNVTSNSKKSVSIKKINIPWECTESMAEGLMGYYNPSTKLWGYCDYAGKIVIEAKYNNVTPFNEGRAQVYQNGNEYVIDKTGNKISYNEVKDEFQIASTIFNSVSDQLIFDRTKKYGIAGNNHFENSVIKDVALNDVVKISDIVNKFPKMKGIGLSDDYISITEYEYSENENENESFKSVTTALIDYKMNVVIEPGKYSYIVPLDKDHFWVANYDRTFGLINKEGKPLIEMNNKQICLLLNHKDDNNTHEDGVFAYTTGGANNISNILYLYNYKVINNSDKNYVLIIDKGENNIASAEIYDLDKNKVVGKISKVNLASEASLIYILPQMVLHTSPFECNDYEGNSIPKGDFPESGYQVEGVSNNGSSTFVNLQGGYLGGEFSGNSLRENMYMEIK